MKDWLERNNLCEPWDSFVFGRVSLPSRRVTFIVYCWSLPHVTISEISWPLNGCLLWLYRNDIAKQAYFATEWRWYINTPEKLILNKSLKVVNTKVLETFTPASLFLILVIHSYFLCIPQTFELISFYAKKFCQTTLYRKAILCIVDWLKSIKPRVNRKNFLLLIVF